MTSHELAALHAFAQDIAYQAGVLTLGYFKRSIEVITKSDDSPVTVADREAEALIRRAIETTYPDHGIIGEEWGVKEARNGCSFRWVIDPIDGTKNFVRGVPVWATLIALVVAEGPVMGLVAAPALGRRWWAAKGSGAYAGRSLTSATRIRTSGVQRLADASISLSSVTSWDAVGRTDAVLDLARDCWRQRAYGDFWSYMLLAEGSVDIASEPELALYDMAALAPIVTEAGGRFTSLDGTDGVFGGNALATNGHLHDHVLERIGL